jgi:hypothetical protein
MTDEELYVHLGRLIEAMPNLDKFSGNKPECMQWLAKAYAIVYSTKQYVEAAEFKIAIDKLGKGNMYASTQGVHEVTSIVLRTFEVLELKVAPEVQGSFIPAGSAFDAYKVIGTIFNKATSDILIVDPYLDGKIITEFAQGAPEKVHIRLLSDKQTFKQDLTVAAAKWSQQFPSSRPLSVRLCPARLLHDRLIITDNVDAWTVTQSFKDFATRSPASIVRSDCETAKLKVAAYDDMWNAAEIVQ